MAVKTSAQLKTEKNTFTDSGANTASKFRTYEENLIDTIFDSSTATDISSLTALSDIDGTVDYLILYDNSDGSNKKVLFKHIPVDDFTALTAGNVDSANDLLPIWDNSATEVKKLTAGAIVINTANTGSFNALKTKVLEIGDWDMDANATTSVAHGLTSDDIRSVQVMIKLDSATSTLTDLNAGGYAYVSTTNVILTRTGSGYFDNTSYDSTGYNRGFILIHYETT